MISLELAIMSGLCLAFFWSLFTDRDNEIAIWFACLITSVICFTINEVHQYKDTAKTVITRQELAELKRFKEVMRK